MRRFRVSPVAIIAVLSAVMMVLLCAAFSPAAHAGEIEVEWASTTKKANANGKFHKKNRRAARILKRSGAIEALANKVNDRYELPNDIPVLFSDLTEMGPGYATAMQNGEKVSFIHVPGHFLRMEQKQLARELSRIPGFRGNHGMVLASEVVIAHEIGHALVDQLDIPITGKEEDAVDGFAFYLLSQDPHFGPKTALAGAVLFDVMSRLRGKLTTEDFADEHSIFEQRVYQFLCWSYGSNPKVFRPLVGKGGLPRHRAGRCVKEYNQLMHSWDRLLQPHLKTAPAPPAPAPAPTPVPAPPAA